MREKTFIPRYLWEVFFTNRNYIYAIFPLALITDEKFSALSSDEKILYILLLNRMNFSKQNKNRFSDEKGVFVYYSNSQIQKHLGCCENTAIKSLNNLQYVGLITKERQKRGLPLKIYVKNIMKDNYSKADYPTAKDVSFDIEKAMMTAKNNRKNFAEKRNKRRTS